MADEFNGNEGKYVSTSYADKLMKNFQSKNPTHIKGVYFGEKLLKSVLSEPKVVGIRFYYAQDDKGNPTLVLVGVDKNKKDVVKKQEKVDSSMMAKTDEIEPDGEEGSGWGNSGLPCPTQC